MLSPPPFWARSRFINLKEHQSLSKLRLTYLMLINRLISVGLKQVLSHTEKSCIASYYRKFFTNIKIKIMKLTPVLLDRAFVPAGITNRFYSYNFHFNIRGKLSIIQWLITIIGTRLWRILRIDLIKPFNILDIIKAYW